MLNTDKHHVRLITYTVLDRAATLWVQLDRADAVNLTVCLFANVVHCHDLRQECYAYKCCFFCRMVPELCVTSTGRLCAQLYLTENPSSCTLRNMT